ncbi:MAG TPA: FG-GAP-like repeat-containing protein, partial [Bacteroidia bacterium]|nr:FG-GAP-like repeat-containing protein [Bacteroidia bacterium]
SPQQIRGILTSSTDEIGDAGWDHLTGAGRLNILKALQVVGASEVQIVSPENDGGAAANSVPVVVTALDPQFRSFDLDYQAGIDGGDEWEPILTEQLLQVWRDTIANWDISGLASGDYTLRLRMDKTNGTTAEDRIRFVIDRSAPTIDLRKVVHAWDNEQRKMLWIYRAADRSKTTLYYRPLGAATFQAHVNDRVTRHGSFLLGIDDLGAGSYEYYLSATNEAGLSAQTALDTFDFTPGFIQLAGFDTLGYAIPMGYYVNATYDFDGDGLKEVAMSEYNDNLGFGKAKFYEYNATQFTAADSLTFKNILIPKDVADTDGDGLQELLCSVNDSLYIVEQPGLNAYPSNITFSFLGQGLYAARFADTDNDGNTDVIAKDFRNYRILEPGGSGFVPGDVLADNSPDYTGSVSPRALVEDFDGDGKKEVVFGDFDGDLLAYEANGSGYARTWLDTTDLTKSGTYLTAGDFDGDGVKEIFVAVHTSLNRNEEDFEYEPLYWWLRIFKATGNDQFAVVFEDFLFDIDTEEYNAATAGNLDLDVADELVFTTFPRTYVLDFQGGAYQMDWFHYGDIATHHLIGDFNGNGVGEVAIGRGDKAIFWEKDFNYQGPQPPAFFGGYVMGATKDHLRWSAVGNANAYRIWRGPIQGNGSILINLIDSTAATEYVDSVGLIPGTAYLYVVESKNLGLSPGYSPFSYAIVLRPHAPGRLDSVVATGPSQAMAYFSVPVLSAPEAAQYFRVNDTIICTTLNSSGDARRQLLLSFEKPFTVGMNALEIGPQFMDADLAPLDSLSRSGQFSYFPDTSTFAFFTKWSIEAESQVEIHFNLPMTNSVLDAGLYTMAPQGRVESVEFRDGQQTAILVTVSGAAFGALGYPVSVTLHGGEAQNGAPMMRQSGNVATFSEFEDALQSAYVYPNPYRRHAQFDGIRFANLSRTATVHVYAASGKKIITLQETDGDGGLEWNMIDLWGDRIVPGMYLFRVESEDLDDFVGKFEVLD